MQHALWFETIGEKEDPTVVLLHGFTGSHQTWERLCKRLSERYFLVVPDLPGHGRSSTAPAMSVDQVSDSILESLEDLGISKAGLLGYSMGGRIALNFVTRHQNRVSCLILESVSPGIVEQTDREERRMKDESLAKDIEQFDITWFVDKWENLEIFATQKNLDQDTRLKIRNERLSNTSAGLARSLLNAGTGAMQPMWSDLGKLEIPVLLIVGEKDEKFVSIACEMKAQIARAGCQLKILNGGHAPHLEDYQMFESTVEQFLDGVYHKHEADVE
ncbi:MAG: 2-succinyl-6-hydroxy-2,4-cyclohexadiene-1-carboxylate synthase [Nitrososphaerota archaeon]|nr:2-succinyl-6-hydroxy-2,4-cyclohexadiene-1-carboxylate synthase [Nitrososphaerota archaeon]